MKPKIKICGITKPEEVALLDDLDVSFAGLWYGVGKGRYNLDLRSASYLSAIHTSSLEYILVTMAHDLDLLGEALERGNFRGIQFHGFQLPAFIKKVRQRFGSELEIFKVLHVRNESCVEADLIERYLEAGTDILIIDSYQDTQNIGSTGIRISDEFLMDFLTRWQLGDRVMIAGGIDEHSIDPLYRYFKPYGFDIDSASRRNGLINRQRVEKLMFRDAELAPA